MGSGLVGVIFALLLLVVLPGRTSGEDDNTSFYDNYYVTWGHDHALLLNQETEIQLSLDNYSGAGFESKVIYGSGLFHIGVKILEKNSTGVLTAFYTIVCLRLSSRSTGHDEIDIELLGNDGPPYKLHTNLYTIGQGNKEQQFLLWFDPTKDFHSYKILWNKYQVVLYVDNVPVRVFKNHTKIGVSYPTQPMHIMASIWNAEGWASDGKKIDWSQAPFLAHFQEFRVDACVLQHYDIQQCYSSNFWWNSDKYWKLNPEEQRSFENVRKKHLVYDYCSDKSGFQTQPQECRSNH